MIGAIIKSNFLDAMVPVDDTTFTVDIPLQWTGNLRGVGNTVDQDVLPGVAFLYADLLSAPNFAAKLKTAVVAKAGALNYVGLSRIYVLGFSSIAVP